MKEIRIQRKKMFKIRSLLIRWNKRKILITIDIYGSVRGWGAPGHCHERVPQEVLLAHFSQLCMSRWLITCHGPAHSRAGETGVTTGLVSTLITCEWIQALISVCVRVCWGRGVGLGVQGGVFGSFYHLKSSAGQPASCSFTAGLLNY